MAVQIRPGLKEPGLGRVLQMGLTCGGICRILRAAVQNAMKNASRLGVVRGDGQGGGATLTRGMIPRTPPTVKALSEVA